VTGVCRFLRGTLPALVAFAIATAFALPASAAQLAPAPRAAVPDLAGQWWLTSLHVPQAWRTAAAKGAGVTVAVLSTGVSASQQDLSGAVLTGPDYTGSGRVAGGPFWGFEGTAVAGLIAGHGHGAGGATGSMGVAPRARILSVPVTLEYDDPLNSDASITSRLPDAIATGIRYAVDHGARVIALPLDPGTLGLAADGNPAAAGGSRAERAAVAYAVAHDVVLVAPAGDNGAGTDGVNYPAAYPGVLAVGATTRAGQLASFTNERSYVALTAPGTGLTVAEPGGQYGTLATTDMSAALAAGVAALIRSRFPGLSAAAVAQAMERGVTGRPAQGAGHGALDAAGALTAAAAIAARQAPTATPTPTVPPSVAPVPAPVHAATSTPARSGAGILAGSVLRDAVIVLGVLIAALAAAIVVYGTRRRRAAAARAPRPASQGGGIHARRPRAALPAAPAAAPPPLDDAWGRPPYAQSGRVVPRLAPPPPAGSLGSPSRPRRRGETGEPPWGPASPPGTIPSAARDELLPPWELSTGLAAAPVTTELPELPRANTGPMYVWNPSASGPLPVLPDDGEEENQLFRTGPWFPVSPAIFPGQPGLHVRRVLVHVLLTGQLTDRAHHLVGDGAPCPGRRLASQVIEVHPLADPDLDPGRPRQRRARRQHLPRAHHGNRDYRSTRVQRQVPDPGPAPVQPAVRRPGALRVEPEQVARAQQVNRRLEGRLRGPCSLPVHLQLVG